MTDKALEAALKAAEPELFSDNPEVAHKAASPLKVDVVRDEQVRKITAVISAYLSALPGEAPMVRLDTPMGSDAKIPEYDAVPDHPRIWLQPFAGDNGGHTWCSERSEKEDIEYVRLDVHQAALLAAEQRGRKAGLEEAAKVAEGYYDHVPDALRDAQDPVAVEVQTGIAAAIRSLGEKP